MGGEHLRAKSIGDLESIRRGLLIQLQAVEAELASRKQNRAACPCGVVTMHRRRPCEEGLECPDVRKVAGGGRGGET